MGNTDKPVRNLDVIQPACRHLLSKGMYVTGTMNPSVEDGRMGDGYCWCSKTQGPLGPDREFVERKLCNSGRNCYEAIL